MKCSRSWSAGASALAVLLCSSVVPAHAQDSRAVPVERLAVRYAAGAFTLLAKAATRKVLPPSDSLPAGERPPAGFWYEHRSAEGELRYRRIIENPVLLVFEGPDGAKPGIPDRKEGLPAERVFDLLIPRSSPGDVVALFSSPLQPDAQGQPAQQVALLRVNEPVIGFRRQR